MTKHCRHDENRKTCVYRSNIKLQQKRNVAQSKALGGIFAVYELLPAFIISFIAIIIFSKLDKTKDESLAVDFDKAVKFSKEK